MNNDWMSNEWIVNPWAAKNQGWECPRCHSCYSPQERCCPNCNSGNYESTVYFIVPDDANITPNQVRELQDALRALVADMELDRKFIVLPPRSKVISEKNV